MGKRGRPELPVVVDCMEGGEWFVVDGPKAVVGRPVVFRDTTATAVSDENVQEAAGTVTVLDEDDGRFAKAPDDFDEDDNFDNFEDTDYSF